MPYTVAVTLNYIVKGSLHDEVGERSFKSDIFPGKDGDNKVISLEHESLWGQSSILIIFFQYF